MPHYTWFMCSWEVNLGLHAHAYLVSTLATETQPQLHGAPPLGHCSGENLAVILNPGHDSKPSALGSWAGHLLGPLFFAYKMGTWFSRLPLTQRWAKANNVLVPLGDRDQGCQISWHLLAA